MQFMQYQFTKSTSVSFLGEKSRVRTQNHIIAVLFLLKFYIRTTTSVILINMDLNVAFINITVLLLFLSISRQCYCLRRHGCVLSALFRVAQWLKKVKVAHTWLPSVGFWSWSRFLAVSLQVMWVINLAVGCHYFPPGLQLPLQPLTELLPILLLGEQRHNGCEQFT